MKIESFIENLTKGIISENRVIEYIFTFSTQQNGNIIAYDNELQVTIKGEWKLENINEEISISIIGFEGLTNYQSKFLCKINDLNNILRMQSSAYDLVGQ